MWELPFWIFATLPPCLGSDGASRRAETDSGATSVPHCRTFQPNGPSVFTYKILGRLGNQMMGYAMMLALREAYGYDVFLDPSALHNLRHYFDGIDDDKVKSLNRLCHDDGSFPWQSFAGDVSLLGRHDLKRGHAFELPPKLRLLGNNLMTGSPMRFDRILERTERSLREAFRFRPPFKEAAERVLREVDDKYHKWRIKRRRDKGKKKLKRVRPVFVGVHVRKTDSEAGITRKYNMPVLEASYYLEACHLFAERHKHVAFVLVGDDREWIRRRLLPRAGGGSVFFHEGGGGGSDAEAVGADLATLSACNHTVLSYGTFSFWGGFLSGGKRGLPFMTSIGGGSSLGRHAESDGGPLSKALPAFFMADNGLFYKSDEELAKERRGNW